MMDQDPANSLTTNYRTGKRGRKKRKKDTDRCLICDDKSVGINYGIQTCSPCKAFFCRNANKLKMFLCKEGGNCSITVRTRRKCNFCRLTKCFRVGMNPDAILTDEQNEARRQLVTYNRQLRNGDISEIRPINLLKYSVRTCLSLSFNDQTVLANIFNAYEGTCSPSRFNDQSLVPRNNNSSIQNVLNFISPAYLSFMNFLKSIPEFSNLPMEIRIYLLKSNFNQIFRLNKVLLIHKTGNADDVSSNFFKDAVPMDLYISMFSNAMDFIPFAHDPVLLQLMLLIFMLSTSLTLRQDVDPQKMDMKTLLCVQDLYTELLWRYIQYRSSTFRESVQLLALFVRRLLYSQILVGKFSEYLKQTTSNNVDSLEPIMKAVWLDEK